MSEPVVWIQPKNNLLLEKKKIETINKVSSKIRGLPQFESNPNLLKMDLEMLLFACQIVEALIVKSKKDKHSLSKKEIVLGALELAFTRVTAEEKLIIEKNIEFLHDNKRIKKMSVWNIVSSSVCEWITRKVL
jgi:hypothetical protein